MNKDKYIESIVKNFGGKFNPYLCMKWVFEVLVDEDTDASIAIVGHSPIFRKHIVQATHAVQVEKGLLTVDTLSLPDPQGNYPTHTSNLIRFKCLGDSAESMVPFQEICKQNRIVVVCGDYRHPNMKASLNNYQRVNTMYYLGNNNS